MVVVVSSNIVVHLQCFMHFYPESGRKKIYQWHYCIKEMQSTRGKKLLKTKKKALGFLVLIIGYVFTATVGKCSALTHEWRNVYLLQFRGIVVTGTLTHSCHHLSLFLSVS